MSRVMRVSPVPSRLIDDDLPVVARHHLERDAAAARRQAAQSTRSGPLRTTAASARIGGRERHERCSRRRRGRRRRACRPSGENDGELPVTVVILPSGIDITPNVAGVAPPAPRRRPAARLVRLRLVRHHVRRGLFPGARGKEQGRAGRVDGAEILSVGVGGDAEIARPGARTWTWLAVQPAGVPEKTTVSPAPTKSALCDSFRCRARTPAGRDVAEHRSPGWSRRRWRSGWHCCGGVAGAAGAAWLAGVAAAA